MRNRKLPIYLILFLLGFINCSQSKKEENTSLNLDSDSIRYVEELETREPENIVYSYDLDMLCLKGNVKSLQYDSLLVKYDKEGNMTYWSFNDSINYLTNVKRDKYNRLITWGHGPWQFKARWRLEKPDEKNGEFLYALWIYKPFQLSSGKMSSDIYAYRLVFTYPEEHKKFLGSFGYAGRDVAIVDYVEFNRYQGGPTDFFRFDQYVFDEHGNWIKRRRKSDHERTINESRIIEYYD